MNKTTVALVAAMLTACAAFAQTEINETRPAGPNGIVEVSNVKGTVTVTGVDASEVNVTGTLGKGSERLDVTGSGPRISVLVVIPKESNDVDPTNLELAVPRGSSVEVECVSGTIKVSGVSGRVRLNTVNGGITVADAKGEAYLKTVNGNIALSGSPADAEVETVRGAIGIKGVTNRVSAGTINGTVTIEGEGLKRLSVKTVRGNISFAGSVADDASVDITSQQGGIKLSLPESTPASFDLSTFTGNISNSLVREAPASAEKSVVGQALQFTIGAGSASIRARAFNGTIEVSKR
ncbi:MAG: DUF4097 family beta strand repeat-containing protein [Candidatus Hydrogenedentales bacterium]|jgi:DUF4097 and DUF4098 domain-containing protein YvlB